ncbi:MAG: DUF4185 domain-containing protein [Nigerium sp.]|nr:DUF4185 domain-containing protein [Nigerium sp.]
METSRRVPMIGPGSLAQGSTASVPGMNGLVAPPQLDAVVLGADGSGLWHYRRGQHRPDQEWRRGALISPDATGPGAIMAASDRLHVFVPEPAGIAHYSTHAGPRRRTGWALGAVSRRSHTAQRGDGWDSWGTPLPGRAVSATLTGGVLVVAVTVDDGVEIWADRDGWRPEHRIPGADAAALAPSGTRLGAVVRRDGHWRFWTPASTPSRPTTSADTLAAGTSAAIAPLGDGWLVAVADGDRVETWTIAGAAHPRITPAPAGALTWGAGAVAAVALAPTRLHGWVQALTDEDGSVFHHHRQVAGERSRWMRNACLRLDDRRFTIEPVDSHKLAQVSGEVDTQPGGRPTLSRSESTAGVRGTDLGVRVEHRGQSYLLFGDTHWRRRPWLVTRDAIARITASGPTPGLPGFAFHGAPLRIEGDRVTMREYDVPLDGFSVGGDFFLLATSNHFARAQTMGRSVLARAVDPTLTVDPASRRPLRFTALTTLSDHGFINLSAQRFPAARVPGFGGDHDLILLFGTDAYRAGNLRLAVLDPGRPGVADALTAPGPIPRGALGVRYWAGEAAGVPVWSASEDDARPLFRPGAFGEISVRWVPAIERFVLLACSGPEDPIGPAVTLRTSPAPWGPWTPRRRLFDWVAQGMRHGDPAARFIKAYADGSDVVGDRVFRQQADSTGAGYAPYLFDAVRDGDHLVLRYTLSTWNPYQVVLMSHRLSVPMA